MKEEGEGRLVKDEWKGEVERGSDEKDIILSK